MKQTKKSKLALATQTVRSMTIAEAQLAHVGGGSLVHTRPGSQCTTNQTAGITCKS